MRGKSTITALKAIAGEVIRRKHSHKTALVAVDIAGAFDNAWHPKIIQLLDQHQAPAALINVIRSYLTGRTVQFTYGNITVTKPTNHGTPQGGIFSPFLWNILLNDFLSGFELPYARVVAYADDVTFVIWANAIFQLKNNIEHCIRLITNWWDSVKITISTEKTGLVYFHSDTHLPVNPSGYGSPIQPGETIKVLGITIKNHRKLTKLDFVSHVNNIISKASWLKSAIFSLCARTWGISKNCNLQMRHSPYAHLRAQYLVQSSNEDWKIKIELYPIPNPDPLHQRLQDHIVLHRPSTSPHTDPHGLYWIYPNHDILWCFRCSTLPRSNLQKLPQLVQYHVQKILHQQRASTHQTE